MTSETRGRWMLVAGLIGVLVFLGVCGTVLKGVRDDRAAIEARVGWLMGLQTTESPADATGARRAFTVGPTCASGD